MQQSPEFTPAKNRDLRGLMLKAIGTLAIGLCLTAVAVWQRGEKITEAAHTDFKSQADRMTAEIERRMRAYDWGLRAARGLFAASRSVERGEFRVYVQSWDMEREFTGCYGLGFIQRVNQKDLEVFVQTERADEAPDFSVRTSGNAPDLRIIKFIEPLESNRQACGYDIGVDPAGREAAERSMLTGEATLSGKITLTHDNLNRCEVLYLMPVYQNGANVSTPQDRKASLSGWAYFPLVMEQLLNGVVESADDTLNLEVFDGTELTKESVLFDYGGNLLTTEGEIDAEQYAQQMFGQLEYIKVGGRQWLVRIGSTPKFEAMIDRSTPRLVGIGGAVVSVLLAVLVWSQGRSRSRAMALLAAESERRFNSLVDASPSLIWTTGTDAKATHFNRGWLEFTGRTMEQEIGEGWTEGIHPEDLGRVRAGYMAAFHSQSEFANEYRLRHHDGEYRWIYDKGSPNIDASGVFHGYVGLLIDVTKRREIEEANRRFSDVLQRTGAMAHVGGWEIDLLGEKLMWTDEVYRIHEVDPGTPVGMKNAINFYAPESRALIERAIHTGIERGEPWDLELPLITAKGKRLWVRTQGEAEMLSGKAVKLRGMLQDITERKRNEAALIEARTAAEAASRAKSEFLANMSHEIRTPLTAILGYADVLREAESLENAPEERLQAIDTIQSAGTHLMAILNDILDLSKIEAGKMEVEAVETPLVEVLAEIESLFRPRAQAKGIALIVQLDTPLPSVVVSDPTRLRQILFNLVGNAVKFTESGSVTIMAREAQSHGASELVIDVEDTGPGLTEEHASRLFFPFSQADTTVTRRHGGTGLGLTICRRLAELMGGSVVIVRTAPGKGSCFRALFPLVRAPGAVIVKNLDAVQAGQSVVMPTIIRLSGRILLAEDGPDNQRLISFHLRKAGATVDVAEDGRVALTMIEQAEAGGRPYDLLLTDMQMPEMDGYSLARELRVRGSELAIVALTAHAMSDDRKRCTDAGCDDYAAKPIDKASLLQTCHVWMHKQGGQRERRAAA